MVYGNDIKHNENAGWIKHLDGKLYTVKQADSIITEGDVKNKVKSIPNWKGPCPDAIQGYWLKNFTTLHGRIYEVLDDRLSEGDVPEWLVEGRTMLIM